MTSFGRGLRSKARVRRFPPPRMKPGNAVQIPKVDRDSPYSTSFRSLEREVGSARRPRIHDNRSMVDIITLFKKSAALNADADQREGRQGESISHDSP